MRQSYPAKLLRIYISEQDSFEERPLYEAIIAASRAMKIAGATVFRGFEGYGESAQMHTPHLVGHDQPILISIVDSAVNVVRLITAVEKMADTAVMAVSDVNAVRVQKFEAAQEE